VEAEAEALELAEEVVAQVVGGLLGHRFRQVVLPVAEYAAQHAYCEYGAGDHEKVALQAVLDSPVDGEAEEARDEHGGGGRP
jgi:hypothetical protein